MLEATDLRKTPLQVSQERSDPQKQPQTSVSLSKDLALSLLGLMKEVTKDKVEPSTVLAACKCASEIHKILKLNHEMQNG